QGFVKDVGGEILNSVPGHIRVQLLDEIVAAQQPGPGLLSWLGLVQAAPGVSPVMAYMDLFLVFKPTQHKQLVSITLQIAPGPDQDAGERWKPYCDRIFCDLRAYLIGYV